MIKTKISFRLIFAAIATGMMLLTSCSDELITGENGYSQSEGTRTIAVSFGTQTRTALDDDGLTPEFTGKDEWVKVSNSRKSEDCQITVDDDGNASFKTGLKGTLTAVYPATAAKMNGNAIEGVKVSSVQDGTFANANICMAENITDAATFVNQTAILKFYVGEEIGVTSINVTSSGKEIADESKTITVAASGGKTLYDNMPTGQDRRICYVAVKSGTNANTLTFTTKTNTQGLQTKTSTVDATLAIGMMYNAFIPYYVEVGDQKWGYCNIGAFLPEENGHYFSWGNIERYVFDVKWKTSPDFPGAGTVLEGGFSEENYTKTSGYSLNTDIPTNAIYDAAATFLGDKWRMPMKDEFKTLYSSCGGTGSTQVPTSLGTVPTKDKGIYWCTNYNGKTGLLMVNANQEQLFFPAAGYGYNTPLHGAGSESIYWSSTISNTAAQAYTLHSYNREVEPAHSDGRHICLPIRPIYGRLFLDPPVGALPNVFTIGPNEEDKVYFSKGNLHAMWDGTKYTWAFADNQYDHILSAPGNTTISNQQVNAVVDLFGWSTDAEGNNWGLSTSTSAKDYSGSFKDWGELIDNKGTWRTFTLDEWYYLFNSRENASNLYRGKVKICGIDKCLVVAPDNFTGTIESTYDETQWSEAESAGLLCLPNTSYRTGSSVSSGYYCCAYWTSTSTGTDNAKTGFYIDNISNWGDKRYYGYCVRLISNAYR